MGTSEGNSTVLNADDFMDEIQVGDQTCLFYNLHHLDVKAGAELARLPFSIRVLVENLLRKSAGGHASSSDVMPWPKQAKTLPWSTP